MSKAKSVTMLAEHIERRRLAGLAGRIVDPWTRRCPFKGCATQHLTPCEVQVPKIDGSVQLETWFAVACECDAYGQPGRTERETLDNWNGRSRTDKSI